MAKKGKLFIVSAPSGAGKSTLVQAVIDLMQGQNPIERVITYTSKVPRLGEEHGRDYHFISSHEFEEKAKSGFFLEWSTAYGAYYGTPSSIIEGCAVGKSYILIIDREGARQIVKSIPDVVLIWISVPTMEALAHRLKSRGTENEAQVERRLARAKFEIDEEKKSPFYKHYVENNDFNEAKLKIFLIIKNELANID